MDYKQALYNAILEGDRAATQNALKTALGHGVTPLSLLNDSMLPAMAELGERFAGGDALLPDLLVGGRAMQAGLDILEPLLLADRHAKPRVRVCIGSVKGDYHDIGKNIVAMLVRSAGYEVQDLGTDCDVARYEEGITAGARAVLCSCLTVRCANHLRDIVKQLSEKHAVPIIVGGAAMNEAYAREIGAYAYGADASEAVRVLNNLFPRKSSPHG